jgi:hypothetical protein
VSQELVASIQNKTDLRLILPFGLNLRVGDVVSVAESGELGLEGSAQSLLGLAPGRPRRPSGSIDVYRQAGRKVSCEFRAAGKASTLFPQLPKAAAKVDVKLGAARSWVLAMTGRRLASLDEVNRFRGPIIDAYRARVWRKDWALVTSIATASAMTLLAARTADTRLTLTLGATVNASAAMEAKLTAAATVAAASKEVTKCIVAAPTPVACTALRVKDSWLRRPRTGYLKAPAAVLAPQRAGDEDFWEAAVGSV